MSDSEKLLVIVPAFNEEAVLGDTLQDIRTNLPDTDILVVSDASTDTTVSIARQHAGVKVLELAINLGVGGAMRTGYRYAQLHDYDWAVQIDADGQHNPADVPALLQAARESHADVVIGARFAGKGDYQARGPRRWTMRVLSRVLSWICRTRLTDATSGFKCANRRGIGLFASNLPAQYLGDTVEALVIAAKAGLKVTQVPVAMRPRAGGEPSHGPVSSALYLFRAGMALMIALTRRRKG